MICQSNYSLEILEINIMISVYNLIFSCRKFEFSRSFFKYGLFTNEQIITETEHQNQTDNFNDEFCDCNFKRFIDFIRNHGIFSNTVRVK